MSHQKQIDELYNKTQDALSQGISTIIRSISGKENRLQALIRMEKKLTIDILKRINRIAIENEDYETCEAIKDFTEGKK